MWVPLYLSRINVGNELSKDIRMHLSQTDYNWATQSTGWRQNCTTWNSANISSFFKVSAPEIKWEWYRLSVFSSYGNLLIALPGWDDQPVCRDAIIIRTNQEADVCKGNTNLTNIYNHKEPTYHNFLDPGWVFACPEWVALRLTWPCHYKKGQRLSHIQLNTVYSANSHSSELKFAQIH